MVERGAEDQSVCSQRQRRPDLGKVKGDTLYLITRSGSAAGSVTFE